MARCRLIASVSFHVSPRCEGRSAEGSVTREMTSAARDGYAVCGSEPLKVCHRQLLSCRTRSERAPRSTAPVDLGDHLGDLWRELGQEPAETGGEAGCRRRDFPFKPR